MNILDKLVRNSLDAIELNTYKISDKLKRSTKSIPTAVKNNQHASIISEVKFSSPSEGNIITKSNPIEIVNNMINGGAIGLSVLTQPFMFNGSPQIFMRIRKRFDVPMIMKDVIVDKIQIEAADNIGADYILLIKSLFDLKYVKDLEEMIAYSHKLGLKVILETHTENEFKNALITDADIIGINNRDLNTLKVDINTTKKLLNNYSGSKIIISESGINNKADIKFLYDCGIRLFLVGTSIMKNKNILLHVKNLVNAI